MIYLSFSGGRINNLNLEIDGPIIVCDSFSIIHGNMNIYFGDELFCPDTKDNNFQIGNLFYGVASIITEYDITEEDVILGEFNFDFENDKIKSEAYFKWEKQKLLEKMPDLVFFPANADLEQEYLIVIDTICYGWITRMDQNNIIDTYTYEQAELTIKELEEELNDDNYMIVLAKDYVHNRKETFKPNGLIIEGYRPIKYPY